MRFSISADQRDFFVHQGWVEFEGLLDPLSDVEREVRRRPIADLASELSGERMLRFGWCGPLEADAERATLEELGSIQGVAVGLMVRLSGDDVAEVPEGCIKVLPDLPGSGIFFSPGATFSLSEKGSGDYLLMVYAGPRPCYVFNPADRETHALKRRGYVFGDRLGEETHPILTR